MHVLFDRQLILSWIKCFSAKRSEALIFDDGLGLCFRYYILV